MQIAKDKAALQVELAEARREVERMGPKQEALEQWHSSFVKGRLRGDDYDSEATRSPARQPSVPRQSMGESSEESETSPLERLRVGSSSKARKGPNESPESE